MILPWRTLSQEEKQLSFLNTRLISVARSRDPLAFTCKLIVPLNDLQPSPEFTFANRFILLGCFMCLSDIFAVFLSSPCLLRSMRSMALWVLEQLTHLTVLLPLHSASVFCVASASHSPVCILVASCVFNVLEKSVENDTKADYSQDMKPSGLPNYFSTQSLPPLPLSDLHA